MGKSLSERIIYKDNDDKLRKEIVRCRDCKFYSDYDGEKWCDVFDYVTLVDISNMFCAWGERRSGAD